MVCRVFNAKLAELKEDILKRKVLGRVMAHSYVIEFQKRGLPHVHMVLWLHEQDAPKKPEDVDRFVTAEIPDKETSPLLHELVKTHMVHGPCKGILTGLDGPPCWKLRKGGRTASFDDMYCEKDFPKDLCQHTVFAATGSPVYRRRSPEEGGHTLELKSRYVKDSSGRSKTITLDNSWIVPHNRYLSINIKKSCICCYCQFHEIT